MNWRAVGERPPVDDPSVKHSSEMLVITLLRPYLFQLVVEEVYKEQHPNLACSIVNMQCG